MDNNARRLIMGILSYLGIFSLIPFLVEKEDSFVQFHAKQGLNLFILEAIASVAAGILSVIPFIGFIGSILSGLIGLVSLVFTILGIIAVCNNEEKPLPFISEIQIIK